MPASAVAQAGNFSKPGGVYLRDPRLFALDLVSEQFANSTQPLVPERLLVMAGEGGHNGTGNGKGEAPIGGSQNFSMIGQLLALLLSERSGINIAEGKGGLEDLEKFTRQMVEQRQAATVAASAS
ncbi:MAG TPA: hypothetical protein VHY22_13735 [Chthoniobacteraceae bacterium]|nr:hypothetical protein [Chthoniobacteraceae bacterium]